MDAAKSMFAAYFRRGGHEDRVTEVFAAMLQRAPAVTSGVAQRIGLEPAPRYRVETQVRAGRWIIDMRVRGLEEDGTEKWTLWSEHKVNSGFGEGQLPRYREAVGDAPLMAITSFALTAAERRDAEAAGAALLTWRDVLRIATAAPVDGVERVFVEEWVALCTHELEEVHVEPLTTAGVEALQPAAVAVETVTHLVETAFARACEGVGAGKPVAKEWWEAPPPVDSWLASQQCLLYADYTADDSPHAGAGEPAAVVGAFGPWRDPGDLRGNTAARHTFETAGFVYDDFGDGRNPQVEIVQVIPLRELTQAAHLPEQEELFAERMRRVLEDLLAVVVA